MSIITSPKGSLTCNFIVENGVIYYTVARHGRTIIVKSILGLELARDRFINLTVIDEKTTSRKESFKRTFGASSLTEEHAYTETIFTLKESSVLTREMQIVFRMYEDGIAFRYRLKCQRNFEILNIISECTQFNFDANYKCWGCDIDGTNKGAGTIQKCKFKHTPFTIEMGSDIFVTIHESDDVGSCAGFMSPLQKNMLPDQAVAGFNMNSVCVKELPLDSPWRVIIIAKGLAGLLKSSLIEELNPPALDEDTDWIRTGLSMSTIYNTDCIYNDFQYQINTDSVFRYIDFAADNNIPFVTIDAGWNNFNKDTINPGVPLAGLNMQEVSYHAIEKGIGIFIFLDDYILKNYDFEGMIALIKYWNCAGIKHGYCRSVGQGAPKHLDTIASICAQNDLLYVGYKTVSPWGLNRTHPNVIGFQFCNFQLEGKRSKYATPKMLTALPFTNCLAGPIDRGYGLFDTENVGKRKNSFRNCRCTIASQFGQMISINSSFMTLLDTPNSYNAKPNLLQFIKDFPNPAWDETVFVDGKIGEYVVIARRKGKDWFVGAINNEKERTINVNLDFLQNDDYDVEMYIDGDLAHYKKNPGDCVTKFKSVTWGSIVNIKMKPGGGFALVVKPN